MYIPNKICWGQKCIKQLAGFNSQLEQKFNAGLTFKCSVGWKDLIGKSLWHRSAAGILQAEIIGKGLRAWENLNCVRPTVTTVLTPSFSWRHSGRNFTAELQKTYLGVTQIRQLRLPQNAQNIKASMVNNFKIVDYYFFSINKMLCIKAL